RGMPQIEVTFDIDANGIVNVSAKDMATGKEQAMTITGGTALARDDIDKMIKDAEAYAEEDRRRREQVETRNQADQLVHQTQKVLSEQGDKLADDEKAKIESALGELKAVMDDTTADAATLRSKIDALVTVSQGAFSRMYQESSQQQAAAGSAAGGGSDDDVVEAEIVDEGDQA
ncbi:MAG: Hsp70 family protein, partial [Acidimicrobiia bacterium]